MDDVLDVIIMANVMNSYKTILCCLAFVRKLRFLACTCVESQGTTAIHRFWMFGNITRFPLFDCPLT